MPYIDEPVGFPFRALTSVETCGADETSSAGTSVTSGAANTFGSVVQLKASTTKEALGLVVAFRPQADPTQEYRVAICTGGAGSEVELVSFTAGGKGYIYALGLANYATFLIRVPAGTRISAKVASTAASAGCGVIAYLLERD